MIGLAFNRPQSTGISLSPEVQALLSCARAVLDPGRRGEFDTSLAGCGSAESLCEAAVTHGMLGHLHRLVTAEGVVGVDPALVQWLTRLQRASAFRSLRQTKHLLAVLDNLDAAGVRAMPYKGPVWAETLYGDIALRNWVDLDMLVARNQLASAREVLLGLGYSDADRFNTRFVEQRGRSWGELGFSHAEGGFYLELHWEVSVSIGSRALRAEPMLERAGNLLLLGRDVRVPALMDAMFIDSVHGFKHEWTVIEQLLGLAVRVRTIDQTEWPDLLVEAGAAGCRRRLCIAVAHVSHALGAPMPPEIGEIASRDRRVGKHLRSSAATRPPASLPSSVGRDLRVLSSRFATEDSLAASLCHALVRIFYPSREDWELLSLPSVLGWLHFLVRPGRLVCKWTRRLLRGAQTPEAAQQRLDDT